nr:unnamed protein product [Callosobruchus analis]
MYSLRILKKYIDQGTLKIFYHAAFESHVRYGIVMYGRCSTIQKIFIMQKRTLRIMLGMKAMDSCRGKFRSNNILTVYAIFIQECVLFLRKNESLFCPSEPQTAYPHAIIIISIISSVHHLTLPEMNVEYSCIKIFNRLPLDLKILSNLTTLKKYIQNVNRFGTLLS